MRRNESWSVKRIDGTLGQLVANVLSAEVRDSSSDPPSALQPIVQNASVSIVYADVIGIGVSAEYNRCNIDIVGHGILSLGRH